ncbi:alpha-N-acetylgalactosaminide alpha-2,6-sialyltransferase 2 [Echeneis naucrates]|uniref:alpha-N-acetylgalactosaminide alpha-2,6-sialyltransferase n=1 Tax=Echeneis naucrates TaxID=173247 RepID=A0A665WRF4_ECHNA|nr:alpha-N-acetylgalactosaminide alpha-2,6-sialyltransferase 2-like [Echeneis naucrates]XP_029383968.1 alpha-N-acetylgalactosaminide alpha-2,6-sialyltransferase 2-like [Echeneis naucrates]XP_029383969.1 alpha-N-acetylgalactosaminide alpha-2,6-sialyltransferase 2-like [Echeneis naucrates]
MAFKRKVVLGVMTAIFILSIYVLCVNLEGPPSWSFMIGGTNSISGDSAHPLQGQRSSDGRTHQPPTSTRHPDTNNANGDESKSESRPNGPGRTRTDVETPKLQPPRSTEPPFIGDTYTSEDVPLQTDCTESIRSHVAQTEFGARFLPNIPVLQWAKHPTPEQHQRLSQYQGVHGWASFDLNMLVDTLSVLNLSANSQMLDGWRELSNGSRCTRCAVVGNGGILKDSGKGTEIDGHHYVFRTNGAIIKGFEQDVGSRTTHYTFSTNTLMNSMRNYAKAGYGGPPVSKETRYVFLPDHDRDYLMMKAAATHTLVKSGHDKNKDPLTLFGKDVSAAKLKMYHPDFVRYLRNRFLRSNTLKGKYKDIYRPSTGAVMLLAAVHTCDQVSAYGFMTPDYKNYSDHYYDSIYRPVGFYANHDLRMEMNLWQQLHQTGLIRLYMHK